MSNPESNVYIAPLGAYLYGYGTLASYECYQGRRTETGHVKTVVSCGGTGQWLGADFTCEGMTVLSACSIHL